MFSVSLNDDRNAYSMNTVINELVSSLRYLTLSPLCRLTCRKIGLLMC
jgi:hypothetical protein